MTTLKSLFLVKEGIHQQSWSASQDRRYNVGALYDFAKDTRTPEPVFVGDLEFSYENTDADEPKESEAFRRRSSMADTSYPLLVVRVVDEDGDRLWIADGLHRFAKLKDEGEVNIYAYVLDEDELPSWTLADPKRGF